MACLEEDDCSFSAPHCGISSHAFGSYGVAEKVDSGVGESLREDVVKLMLDSVKSFNNQEALKEELTDTDVCDSAVCPSVLEKISMLDINEFQLSKVDDNQLSRVDSCDTTISTESSLLPVIENIFCPDEDGDTKLHLAIIQPDVDAATWMSVAAIAATHNLRRALLNTQNYRFRQTPLHLAVVTNQPQLTRILVVCGADQNVRDFEGNTPMHLACTLGNMACIEALALQVSQEEQQQLIQYSQSYKLPAFTPPVASLPDFFCLDYEGRSCVHLVQSLKKPNRLQILNFLVQLQHSQLDIQDGKSGQTILHLAVKKNDREMLNYLLSNAKLLNINRQDYSFQTALDIARRLKLNNVAELLQRFGARHSDSFVLSDDQSDDSSDDDEMADYDDLTVGGQRLHTISIH